jgi:hypothetical protein
MMLNLLQQLEIQPVLVDVGAAGAPPAVWEPIAPRSVYVGFDPEPAGNETAMLARYARAIRIERAVSPLPGVTTLPLYLTRLRCCSSTLQPRSAALAEHWFAPLFEVERETSIEAVPLGDALANQGLQRVDWLKIDSQGADLRIYQSLPDALRRTVLALDVEPGLIDAYQGEDLFAEAHAALTADGFWLSDLELHGTPRIRQTTLEHLQRVQPALTAERLQHGLRNSPGWCNARYLRSPAWLREQSATPTEYVLLGCFALLDRQPGFALDVALACRQHFGADAHSDCLHDEAVRRLLAQCASQRPASQAPHWLRKLKRRAGQLIHALLS